MICLINSEELSRPFTFCAFTFASDSEKNDFIEKESLLLPEGSSYRVNLFDNFVEIKIPESCLHSVAAQALGDCIVKQITAQLYSPGTDTDDTGLMTGGTFSTFLFMISAKR